MRLYRADINKDKGQMKNPNKTHYRLKRLISSNEKESRRPQPGNSTYMVMIHNTDGSSEWVDTLTRVESKVNDEPFYGRLNPYNPDEKRMENWKSIHKKVLKKPSNKKSGLEVWVSEKDKEIKTLQLKIAFNHAVVYHIRQTRDDYINTKSNTSN